MHIIASTTLKPYSSTTKPHVSSPTARPSDTPAYSSTVPYSKPQVSSVSTTSVPPSFVTKPRDPTSTYGDTTTPKATTKPPTVHIKPKPQAKPTAKPLAVSSSKPPPSVTIVTKPASSVNTNLNKKPSSQSPSSTNTIVLSSTTTTTTTSTPKPNYPQKPSYNTTKPQKPSKPTKQPSSKPSSGTKKPINPTSTPYPDGYSSTTTSPPSSSNSYIPIPVTTVSSSPSRPSIVTLSSFKPTQSNIIISSQQSHIESSTKPTHAWSSPPSYPAPMNISTTVSLEQIEEETNMIGGGTAYGTSTAPSLVTWTTVDEIPIIPPDRTRPPPLVTTIKAPPSTGK